mmetsp:Transcript_57273/g.170789  ORF Transcript_57273/g.170789 Transcript_57273/m.170789 type:complete len:224 (-) Transcript_57273:976-1647(-)
MPPLPYRPYCGGSALGHPSPGRDRLLGGTAPWHNISRWFLSGHNRHQYRVPCRPSGPAERLGHLELPGVWRREQERGGIGCHAVGIPGVDGIDPSQCVRGAGHAARVGGAGRRPGSERLGSAVVPCVLSHNDTILRSVSVGLEVPPGPVGHGAPCGRDSCLLRDRPSCDALGLGPYDGVHRVSAGHDNLPGGSSGDAHSSSEMESSARPRDVAGPLRLERGVV